MMSEVLSKIREQIGEDNLINSCSSRACRVDMTGVPRERIVINVDTVEHDCPNFCYGSSDTIPLSAPSCCAKVLSSGLRFTACMSESIAFWDSPSNA